MTQRGVPVRQQKNRESERLDWLWVRRLTELTDTGRDQVRSCPFNPALVRILKELLYILTIALALLSRCPEHQPAFLTDSCQFLAFLTKNSPHWPI